jgi:hypothetical protein
MLYLQSTVTVTVLVTRVTVKIWETTHKRLAEFSEAKETSLAEVIDKAVTRYMGHISDRAEIQELKTEIEKLKSLLEATHTLEKAGASQPAPTPSVEPTPSTTSVPIPLAALSKVSTETQLGLRNGSKAIVSISDRLEYQRQKAEIWLRAKVQAEKEFQTIKEQVKRFRNDQSGKRSYANFDGIEKGEPDHGRPDFD